VKSAETEDGISEIVIRKRRIGKYRNEVIEINEIENENPDE